MKLYHRNGGTFGITIYRNRNMNGPLYGDLLVDSVIPELKRTNGGVLGGPRWSKVVQMIQSGPRWSKVVQNYDMDFLSRNFRRVIFSGTPCIYRTKRYFQKQRKNYPNRL